MFNDFHAEVFSWIRGALLVLFLINFTVFLQNKNKLFLFYSLYLLCIFLYFLKPIVPYFLVDFYTYCNYSILYLSFVFYVQFARILISTKRKLPAWDVYFVLEIKVLLVFVVLIPLVHFLFGAHVYRLIVFVFSVLIALFSIISYFALAKVKGRNVGYFIFGSVTFLLLGNVSTFSRVLIGNEEMIALGIEPMIFTYVGALIDAFVFTFIMGRIFVQIVEKKSVFKVQYLLKQKEAAELKMTALQSQMNPHFLFNSLNSINNFVLKNNIDEASEYITSFSKLIRQILANSERSEITLAEELELLEVYIGLEKVRISGGFEFVKSIDPQLNLNSISVPPLFLQPFIENSIWHGLVDKKGKKRIELKLLKQGAYIHMTIEDNGIGIKNSRKQKKKLLTKKKFFGATATEKRIKLLYDSSDVFISINDLENKDKQGTIVKLIFPLKTS
ncbi:sensor histidine kinase [Flavicella sediminum]|uniref:sensor histidine kinase n=1 Tax=Flavicella sediminum TaxID=2585141 RepID=UPI001124B1CE|nr:histidine kinase [Flavicella sediminum]